VDQADAVSDWVKPLSLKGRAAAVAAIAERRLYANRSDRLTSRPLT
jgi:hypothetical protein